MVKKQKKDAEPAAADVFEAVAIDAKMAKTAVLLLNSPEDEIIVKSCEALYRFGEKADENKQALLGMGAVDLLMKLIRHEERAVRRNAIMALGVMSTHADVRRELRKYDPKDYLKPVQKLLDPEEEVIVHEFATLYLSSLSKEYTTKVQVYAKEGVQPLIEMIKSPDPDVKKNAVEAINFILDDFRSRHLIKKYEGLEPLLESLKSEYPAIQTLAFDCLEKLSQDATNREALRDLDALDHILKFLNKTEWSDLHINCLRLLSNMLEDTDTTDLLYTSGSLQKLITFITSEDTNQGVKEAAANAIARAANHEENRRIFHEADLEKTLISLLSNDNENRVRSAAARGIANMSANLSSRDYVGRKDGIPPLVNMLRNDKEDVREAASLTLANLTAQNAYNCAEIYEKNGLDHLITMLADTKEACQGNACATLTNMAPDIILRAEMIKKGVIQALNTALASTNTTTQCRAALATAAIITDGESRSSIRESGGLEYLVKLLGSGADQVRRNAAWAICVCCADQETASELAKHGAMDVLLEIKQSGRLNNRFTDAAYQRMLDNSLPAKYAFTGSLDYTDFIDDGFFDCGHMSTEVKFTPLEEMGKEEVNERRPVLLINSIDTMQQMPGTPAPSSEGDPDTKRLRSSVSTKTRSKAGSGKSTRSTKKKVETEVEELVAVTPPLPDQPPIIDQPFVTPYDSNLEGWIRWAKGEVLPLETNRQQCVELGMFVANKMGGPINPARFTEFSYELDISRLKVELQSNVIPIGMIKNGIHYHRALLFKTLADRIGLQTNLHRGQYNRAWNEVMLVDEDPEPVDELEDLAEEMTIRSAYSEPLEQTVQQSAPATPKDADEERRKESAVKTAESVKKEGTTNTSANGSRQSTAPPHSRSAKTATPTTQIKSEPEPPQTPRPEPLKVPPIPPVFPPKRYIIDLVYEPGRLMKTDHPDAISYQRI